MLSPLLRVDLDGVVHGEETKAFTTLILHDEVVAGLDELLDSSVLVILELCFHLLALLFARLCQILLLVSDEIPANLLGSIRVRQLACKAQSAAVSLICALATHAPDHHLLDEQVVLGLVDLLTLGHVGLEPVGAEVAAVISDLAVAGLLQMLALET